MNARALALAALEEWRRGRLFADTIIQSLLARSSLSAADRGFTTELFYGVLRNLTLLDFWIAQLRSGALDHASRDLLRLGIYQLLLLNTPGHAAVFETVALSGRRNRALINGVLRSATRRKAELRTVASTQPLALQTSHPAFLVERWQEAFGNEATGALCKWNNEPARVYARTNRLRISTDAFRLSHPQIEPLASTENFVGLREIPFESIARGELYVQDPSTAVACELLDPQPGETILDACAAPGGKSGYLAELMQNRGTLVACDRDASRVEILRENLERLGVSNAAVVRHDWTSTPLPDELRGVIFDRILLDAPCTNTGVMRRRVDVRWRLRPNDFARMAKEQIAILRAIVPLLRPGGSLVYSTCSIEAEENERVVTDALREFPFLKSEEQKSALPFRDGFDGAFAARLSRVS